VEAGALAVADQQVLDQAHAEGTAYLLAVVDADGVGAGGYAVMDAQLGQLLQRLALESRAFGRNGVFVNLANHEMEVKRGCCTIRRIVGMHPGASALLY